MIDPAVMTDRELTEERRSLFGYTDSDKIDRSRAVCDEIARRRAR